MPLSMAVRRCNHALIAMMLEAGADPVLSHVSVSSMRSLLPALSQLGLGAPRAHCVCPDRACITADHSAGLHCPSLDKCWAIRDAFDNPELPLDAFRSLSSGRDLVSVSLLPCCREFRNKASRHFAALEHALQNGLGDPARIPSCKLRLSAALASACLAGDAHARCVELFLAHGADPLFKDASGNTLLHLACQSGASSVLSTLLRVPELRAPSCLLAPNDQGRTALYLACAAGAEEAVRTLTALPGLDRTLFDTSLGESPFDAAFLRGHLRVVHLALEQALSHPGAVWPVCQLQTASPAHIACLKAVIRSGRVRWHQNVGPDAASAVHAAVSKDHLPCLLELINCAPMDTLLEKDPTGRSLVHLLCAEGLHPALSALLDRLGPRAGAMVDTPDLKGIPPLLLAAAHECEPAVCALLRSRPLSAPFDMAQLTKASSAIWSEPLLHLLARKPMPTALDAVLARPELRAEVNALHKGLTPLHTACQLACSMAAGDARLSPALEAVRVLVRTPTVDLDVLSLEGVTAARICFDGCQREALKALLEAGADPVAASAMPCCRTAHAPKGWGCSTDHFALVKGVAVPALNRLLPAAPERSPQWATALCHPSASFAALAKGHTRCFVLLLQRTKQPLTAIDPAGNTLAHVACSIESLAALKALFGRLSRAERKRIVRTQNSQGDTPLHIACRVGNWEIYKRVRRFSDFTLTNQAGCSPQALAMPQVAPLGLGLAPTHPAVWIGSSYERVFDSSPYDPVVSFCVASPEIAHSDIVVDLVLRGAALDMTKYRRRFFEEQHAYPPDRHRRLHQLFRALSARDAKAFALIRTVIADDVVSVVLAHYSAWPPSAVACPECWRVVRSLPRPRQLALHQDELENIGHSETHA